VTELRGLLSWVVHDFLLLFAMVNAVGNLPIFASLTSGMAPAERLRAYRTAVATAASIVVGVALLGDWMLRSVFQVGVEEFKVAGGILVFFVAARGMILGPLRALPPATTDPEHVGVFPMGFPFLAGPGTIVTTILLMQDEGSVRTVVVAVLVYLAILPLMRITPAMERAVGRMGVLVVSRILYVFICAKSVSFFLTGLQQVWRRPY
jgi:multiple antibiotic resistance protein